MKKIILLLPFILAACTKSPALEEKPPKTEFEYKQTMPAGGNLVDESRGEEVWLAIGAVMGTKETPANGVAQAHYFDSGVYQQGLQVNINLPEDGTYFEGWVKNPTTGDMISTGKLNSLFGDVRHASQFEIKQDLRSYTSVIVTLEHDDGNPKPGTQVAEATLKQVNR